MSGVLTFKVDFDIRVNLPEPLDVREVDGLGDKDLQCHGEMTTSRSTSASTKRTLKPTSFY